MITYQAVFISKLTCQFTSFSVQALCKQHQLRENNDHTLQKQGQLWAKNVTEQLCMNNVYTLYERQLSMKNLSLKEQCQP